MRSRCALIKSCATGARSESFSCCTQYTNRQINSVSFVYDYTVSVYNVIGSLLTAVLDNDCEIQTCMASCEHLNHFRRGYSCYQAMSSTLCFTATANLTFRLPWTALYDGLKYFHTAFSCFLQLSGLNIACRSTEYRALECLLLRYKQHFDDAKQHLASSASATRCNIALTTSRLLPWRITCLRSTEVFTKLFQPPVAAVR